MEKREILSIVFIENFENVGINVICGFDWNTEINVMNMK